MTIRTDHLIIPRHLRHAAAATAAVVALGLAGPAVGAQSRSQQVAQMHRQEVMASIAGQGGVQMGTGLPTGARLVRVIVADQPSLDGVVTGARVGTRGHIGVGQTTSSEFVAVGMTADGTVVRYSAAGVQGL